MTDDKSPITLITGDSLQVDIPKSGPLVISFGDQQVFAYGGSRWTLTQHADDGRRVDRAIKLLGEELQRPTASRKHVVRQALRLLRAPA